MISYAGGMRGGLERWKRGVNSQGVRQAIAYAMEGTCDAHIHAPSGVDALGHYSDVDAGTVTRFVVEAGQVTVDQLDAERLGVWVDGRDPETGERRGRELASPDADLVLDGTINAPKSYSIAALLHPELAAEYERLQDRLRDQVITTWQRELNARRGAGGRVREGLQRIEVVELQHERSRALDPHIHRHLWLNVKVLGEDGRWSNIDSRVAMKMHTVINAEGEIAARTDPAWVAALARHGYTLNEAGEISELAHVVRPLSRRSNQIEANRAMRLAQWRDAHPGLEPSPDVLLAIDRWAWAFGRPNKPHDLVEDEWQERTRAELEDVDAGILTPRDGVVVEAVAIADLDRELLAARAVVDADKRSAQTGGRYSLFDVRAGAMRAIAASGVVAERAQLEETIEDVVARAVQMSVDMLDGESRVPAHIKQFMSTSTAAMKLDLAARFDRLNEPGRMLTADSVAEISARVLEDGKSLDAGQADAAAAIAGTARLVTVTGPAGTGKTTLLKVAKAALEEQGRQLIAVAPTKKAASVVGREIGTTASSLHALLLDHGWRWRTDESGAQVWTLLQPGEYDQGRLDEHGRPVVYEGSRRFPLRAGDRIVVDEAGMVDLHTANALAQVAEVTGAGIAMVGDHLQAMPVGHSGAMATMKNRSGSVVELTAVHRFTDPEYGELSLRLREPANLQEATGVAWALSGRGLVKTVTSQDEAREHMVTAYLNADAAGRRVSLVTSTNEEAQQINDTIQAALVDAGRLSDQVVAIGQNEQRLLVGDVVQTRRNDSGTGVENRALWKIQEIRPDGVCLVSVTDSGDVKDVSAEYVADHVHLAYASTVHGIQGETTDEAIVGPGVNAAGLYVGMTRGRERNEAVVIAQSAEAAVDELAATMMRARQEVTLEDASRAALDELSRAARPVDEPTPEDVTPAVWSDRKRRPFGAIIDLDRFVADAPEKAADLRAKVERISDSIHRNAETLRAVRARLAMAEARGHALQVAGVETEDPSALIVLRDRLTASLEDATALRKQLLSEYTRANGTVERAAAERQLRNAMTPEQNEHEHQARIRHARTPQDARTTASAPTFDDGFGIG